MTRAERLAGFAAIPVKEIEPSPNNLRAELTGIPELAVSIKETGLIQPLIVQRLADPQNPMKPYQVIAGHRRLAAVKLLAQETVACIIRRPMRTDDELLAMLVENTQRTDLDPIEEARAILRLKTELNVSEAEVARRIGRTPSFIADRLMLLALPVDEQEEVRAKVMTMTEAKRKARVESGRIRPSSIGRPPGGLYLSVRHPLADAAKHRCVGLGHSRGSGKSVGGIACGECWEAVIRADERTKIHTVAATGRCPICTGVHGATA